MNISTQQAKKQTLIFSFKKLETVEFFFHDTAPAIFQSTEKHSTTQFTKCVILELRLKT